MSNIDFQTGFRYASEILDERSVKQLDVLISGLQQWKKRTAEALINSANQRKAEGVNLSYQDGIIARAEMELKPCREGHAMRWHCERVDSGWLIVCDNGQQYAALIKRSDFQNHYDAQFLFWSSVMNVKFAAMGFRPRRGIACGVIHG